MAIEFLNGINLAGDLELKKTDPKIILFDDSGANGTPNGEIVFSELNGYENFKLRYNGLNDRYEYWGLIGSTSTLVGYWNRSTDTSLHSVGSISTGSDGNSANWKTAYDHSQATHAPTDAEANVQADWDVTTDTDDAYIKNKPTIPTVPDSYAPTDAEANVQADWTETTTTSDSFILNKPSTFAPSAHNHDGDYIQDGGTTAIGDINTIGTESIKHRWNNVTTGRPAAPQANEYGTVTTLTYDSSYATQLAWDIHAGNLYARTLNLGDETGTWKRFALSTEIPTDFVSAASGGSFGGKLTINRASQHVTQNNISANNAHLDLFNTWESDTDQKGSIITFTDNYYGSGSYNKTLRAAIKGGTDNTGNTADGYLEFYTDSGGANTPNLVLRLDKSKAAEFKGNIVMADNATVDGVDISELPTSFAPTDAEANVQVDWTETTTTSDAFILNKPPIPTDYGDHDGLYVPVGGGTITSETSIGLTINHDTFEQGLVLHRNHATNAASIVFKNNGGINGTLFAIASDGAPYWQYNDSASPNYRIHTANDFAVTDVTGALPKAGGTMTGTLVMSAVNPEIHFNGTSDTGVDMAIKATPEGLDFYEPEESNKIHFRILDDSGVDAIYGYNINGTSVISSDKVLANVTGNISMFTNDSVYLTRTTPAAPTTLTTTIVNSTINVGFTASTTTDIDYYLVFSSVSGGSYGLISVIPPADFGATMSIIDNTFDATGTQAYRVYAVKNGVYSSALTGSQAFAVTSAEPTNMSVVNLNTAYYVQWDPPSANARFITAYNVYKHEHATQGSLDRDSATLIYSGLNTSYMYQISGSNNVNYHQFWVETTIG